MSQSFVRMNYEGNTITVQLIDPELPTLAVQTFHSENGKERAAALNAALNVAFKTAHQHGVGLEMMNDGERIGYYNSTHASDEWQYMYAPPEERLKVVVPKCWKQWCRKNGLRPHSKSRHREGWQWFYLKGKGHVWRVSMYANFQCGDTHDEFDRWALCHIAEAKLPKTEKEFTDMVRRLKTEWHATKPVHEDEHTDSAVR